MTTDAGSTLQWQLFVNCNCNTSIYATIATLCYDRVTRRGGGDMFWLNFKSASYCLYAQKIKSFAWLRSDVSSVKDYSILPSSAPVPA